MQQSSKEGEIINALKRQKSELRHQVKQFQIQDQHFTTADRQLDKLERHVQELRKQYDLAVLERKAWSDKLAEELDKIRAAQNSAIILLNQPQGRQIRMLENRVEKVLKKQKEASRIQEAYKQLEEQLNSQNLAVLNQRRQVERKIQGRKKEVEDQEEKIMQLSVIKQEAEQKLRTQQNLVDNQHERRQKKLDACIQLQSDLEKEENEKNQQEPSIQNNEYEAPVGLDTGDRQLWQLLIGLSQAVGVDSLDHLLPAAQAQEKAIAELENQELQEHILVQHIVKSKEDAEVELLEVKEIAETGRGSRALIDSSEAQLRRVIVQTNQLEDQFAEKQMTIAKIVQSTEDMLRLLAENVEGINFENVDESNLLRILTSLQLNLGYCVQ